MSTATTTEGPTMHDMSSTDWALPTPEEEAAALAAVGIELQQPTTDAELDALVSYWLGEMAACDADLARYDVALRLERERLAARYQRITAPLAARRAAYEQAVCAAAERADFGKKASRAVGNGTYGRRALAATVKIIDPAALLAWAKAQAPQLVRQTVKEDVLQKPIKEYFEETGEVPAGVEHVPERLVPFAKPEPTR